MRRYYVEPTGYSNGRMMGRLLNEDGSVYTGDMTDQPFTHKDIEDNLAALVVDGFDIKITKAAKDAEHQPNAKVELLFYQEQEGGTKKAVASLRLSNAQLKDLYDIIGQRQTDFTKG